jgi:hypothetical protein
MSSETNVIKRMAKRIRAGRNLAGHVPGLMYAGGSRPHGRNKRKQRIPSTGRNYVGLVAVQMIMADAVRPTIGCLSWGVPRDRMSKRLERRIMKKAAQPFRRKKRGPQRRRAAGKNEVRPRCR